MFTCGLLPDCSNLSSYLYNAWIDDVLLYQSDEMINGLRFKSVHRYIHIDVSTIYYSEQDVILPHFERLYMESQMTLPGQYNFNQFINVNFGGEEKSLRLFYPSKLYWITGLKHKLYLGPKRHQKVTKASYMITKTRHKDCANIFSIYCMISQSQPANHIFLFSEEFPLSTDFCSLMLSPDIQSFNILNSSVPAHILFDLLKQLSRSPRLNSLYLHDISLRSIKSLNLTNKVKSLSKLILTNVVMDQKFCDNLLSQITSLNKLKRLEVTLEADIFGTAYQDVTSGYGKVCVVSTAVCPELLTALSTFNHLEHLDLLGNNLTGCLSNFIPKSYIGLPSLKKLILNNATLNADDLQHLTHLIQRQKVPNLKELRLSDNDFQGFENEVFHLINACIIYHQTEVKIGLVKTNIKEDLIEKWQSQCNGTHVEICNYAYLDSRRSRYHI